MRWRKIEGEICFRNVGKFLPPTPPDYALSQPRNIIFKNIGKSECGREASPELYSSFRRDPTFAYSWLSIRLHERKQFVTNEPERHFLKSGLCLRVRTKVSVQWRQGSLHTHTHTHTNIYIHTYIHTHTHTHTHTHIYIYIYIYIYTHIHCIWDRILDLMTLETLYNCWCCLQHWG